MTDRASWLDIDLDIISQNIRAVKNYIGNTKLLAVVKANAYGHGILPVAFCAIENGADYLGVSSLEEGILLRQYGIKKQILLFNSILPEQAEKVLEYDLTATVCSFDVVQAINEWAIKLDKPATVHIKVDTGFGRFGVLPEYATEFIKIISDSFDNIYIEGIYTHFSEATNERNTRKQFEIFNKVTSELNSAGFDIPIKHVCNSTATIKYSDMHLDMVRVGNLMYAFCPSGNLAIKNPSKIYSRISFLKNLPKGHYVGYGNRYKTKRPTTVAVVPFGYYDGLELLVSQPNGILDGLKSFVKCILSYFGMVFSTRKVIINGKECSIIGKVGMQNCIIDVTNTKTNVFVGDTVEFNARKVNLCYNIARIYRKEGKVYESQEIIERYKAVEDVAQRRETSIG